MDCFQVTGSENGHLIIFNGCLRRAPLHLLSFRCLAQTAGWKGKMNEEHRKEAYPLWQKCALTIVAGTRMCLHRSERDKSKEEEQEKRGSLCPLTHKHVCVWL